MKSLRRRLRAPLRAGGGALALVALWDGYVRLSGVKAYLLPAPSDVMGRLLSQWSLLLEHLSVTLEETLLGLAIGTLLALVIAVVVVHSTFLRETLYPWIVAIQAMPKVAFAPLLVVWFGLGIESKVVLSVLICFFPLIIASITGLANVEQELVDLARAQGAGQWTTLYLIRGPHALPYLSDGLKVALPLAMFGSIAGEFISGQKGIGMLLLDSSYRLQTDLTFAAVVVIAIATALLFGVLTVVERLALRWHRLELGKE